MPPSPGTVLAVAVRVVPGACSPGRARTAGPNPTASVPAAPTTTSTVLPVVPATTTTTQPPPPLAWAACSGGFECATLPAPLDWDHPDGRTAPLALIRLKATGPGPRPGSPFVNP